MSALFSYDPDRFKINKQMKQKQPRFAKVNDLGPEQLMSEMRLRVGERPQLLESLLYIHEVLRYIWKNQVVICNSAAGNQG